MHLVMRASVLELPRLHTHKDHANKLIVILLQEIRSREICWPIRSKSPRLRALPG